MGGERGREGGGQDGVEWGGKWDNCNSIINKYIKKKKKKKKKEARIAHCLLRLCLQPYVTCSQDLAPDSERLRACAALCLEAEHRGTQGKGSNKKMSE